MTVRDLPVLDLSLLDGPDSVEMLGRSVRHALEEVGFFSIVNHGIPWEQVEAVYELSQR
ncbi:MAG: 2-oxoglutarate and iron-dependent oxygenase domain-containing protein, partial [Acidimicrobiia bacterium]